MSDQLANHDIAQLIVFAVHILMIVGTGSLARRYKRSVIGWVLFGLFWPLVALLVLWYRGPLTEPDIIEAAESRPRQLIVPQPLLTKKEEKEQNLREVARILREPEPLSWKAQWALVGGFTVIVLAVIATVFALTANTVPHAPVTTYSNPLGQDSPMSTHVEDRRV